MADNYIGAKQVKTVTITNGAALSAEIDLDRYQLIGIIPPATVAGTTLKFQAGIVSGALGVLNNSDGAISYPLAAGAPIAVGVLDFLPWRYLKLDTTSNQNADRAFTLILREL